ncbi:TetR/AcrR family transcriptional regulator [Pseudorhodoferax sp. Leaf267]|uniref:TetR/AcrR family transcriptional regulator n=1 Tax=Pseudorhodoferax sp. Leaf267 TaxID=1736316 RepID=UPI0006FC787F|nr:TetR/AcrR family transcriptional regulator [Pseudorhodoferax sp. Leaf267]KQP13567.1 TetR family transcriptional regulator [Pseudorhodoferax sp. Leaf267]
MAKKAPRRTAERILEVTLALFNRLGAPNVSTTLIAAELNISPGNLYYHYPAKDELLGALFDRYAQAMGELLDAGQEVRDVEDAWFFLHSVFERIWEYRFLYRDLNDLLSNNRRLEQHVQTVLQGKSRAVRGMLQAMGHHGALQIAPTEAQTTATSMVVVLTYWLSFEYALAPRGAMEPEAAQGAVLRGATHVLALLLPYLAAEQREHLASLVSAYEQAAVTQKI